MDRVLGNTGQMLQQARQELRACGLQSSQSHTHKSRREVGCVQLASLSMDHSSSSLLRYTAIFPGVRLTESPPPHLLGLQMQDELETDEWIGWLSRDLQLQPASSTGSHHGATKPPANRIPHCSRKAESQHHHANMAGGYSTRPHPLDEEL